MENPWDAFVSLVYSSCQLQGIGNDFTKLDKSSEPRTCFTLFSPHAQFAICIVHGAQAPADVCSLYRVW
jgi:hypothetical protein